MIGPQEPVEDGEVFGEPVNPLANGQRLTEDAGVEGASRADAADEAALGEVVQGEDCLLYTSRCV